LTLLAGAKRPVVMVGSDAWFANAGVALRNFVERTGIPVFSDFAAHGLLPDSHPLYGGTFHKLAYVGNERPDVVLALGLRFSLFTLGNAKSLFPLDAQLIHVDTDAVEIGRLRHTDVGIVADPAAMLAAMNAGLIDQPLHAPVAWARTVQQARAQRVAQLVKEADAHSGPMHPFSAVAVIARAAKEVNAVVVADGAEAYHWLNESIAQEPAGSYLTQGFLGCMGIGLGLAIGVQAAQPKRPVLLMAGDGAIGFNIIEFDSLVRHKLPVVVIVMNNHSWGASEHYQEILPGLRNVGTRLGEVRYHDIAKGFGCDGVYVESVDMLAPAIAAAFSRSRPTCINVRIDRTPIPPELLLMISAT
jgi:acetolactate synthase-1/2/3 large subunit